MHGLTFTWTPSPDPHEAPNPTGCYRRPFDLPPDWCHTSKRLVLCLEGADSAATVWLNGQWLGYTQDSRLPAEFDATVRNAQRPWVLDASVGATHGVVLDAHRSTGRCRAICASSSPFRLRCSKAAALYVLRSRWC